MYCSILIKIILLGFFSILLEYLNIEIIEIGNEKCEIKFILNEVILFFKFLNFDFLGLW